MLGDNDAPHTSMAPTEQSEGQSVTAASAGFCIAYLVFIKVETLSLLPRDVTWLAVRLVQQHTCPRL